MVSAGMNQSNLNNYWGYGAVMVVVAIVVIITSGTKDLSRKWGKVVHQPSLR
jgi:hypothetical protein